MCWGPCLGTRRSGCRGDMAEKCQPLVPAALGTAGSPTSHSCILFPHPVPVSSSHIPFPSRLPSLGHAGGGTYSSLRPQRRLVGLPYLVRVSVSSWYSVSPSVRGMPSQARMRMMMTAFWQWWPARCRTRHSSFSSWLCLRITWETEGTSQTAPINTSQGGENPKSGSWMSWMPSPVPLEGQSWAYSHGCIHPIGFGRLGGAAGTGHAIPQVLRVGSPKEFLWGWMQLLLPPCQPQIKHPSPAHCGHTSRGALGPWRPQAQGGCKQDERHSPTWRWGSHGNSCPPCLCR